MFVKRVGKNSLVETFEVRRAEKEMIGLKRNPSVEDKKNTSTTKKPLVVTKTTL